MVDVSRGMVAKGMRVELYRGETLLAAGDTGANGLLEHAALKERFPADSYRAVLWPPACASNSIGEMRSSREVKSGQAVCSSTRR